MAIRNPKREQLERLASKTLDAQFKTTIQEGLNRSPFEAEAVLDVVHEVYSPFLDAAAGRAPPGKVTLQQNEKRPSCPLVLPRFLGPETPELEPCLTNSAPI